MTYPPIPIRKTVGPKLKKELSGLTEELAVVLAAKSDYEKREKAIKARIKEIALKYDLPLTKSASQYLNVPAVGKALRITRPDPAPVINPEAFLTSVGQALFHELVTVLKVELRLPEWLQALEDERVTEKQLLDCLKEPTRPGEDPITIGLSATLDPGEADHRD